MPPEATPSEWLLAKHETIQDPFARNIEQGATHASGLPVSLTAAAAKHSVFIRIQIQDPFGTGEPVLEAAGATQGG